MVAAAFATFCVQPPRLRRCHAVPMCSAARPPNDPSELRTESERRRNSPPKPMRRRRRRTSDTDLDWERMESVPIVRPDVSPESGEDYWIDTVQLGDPGMGDAVPKKRKKKKINENLKQRLKKEVVSPYENNWILWISLVVGILVLLVSVFGGLDTVPIIPVPDL